MAAITAKARSLTALQATTELSPAEALAIVKQAAEQVKETGYGRSGGKFVKSDVRPRLMEEGDDWLRLMIGSAYTKKPKTVFSVAAKQTDNGCALRVGGLEKYHIFQSKFLGLIPSGPATIINFGLYKKFLKEIGAQLEARDPTATISIGVPAS